MFKYINSSMVLRESDGNGIPTDPANLYYQQVLDWVAAGNTITPADDKPEKPAKEQEADPVQLLSDFLRANPAVLALVSK